MVHRSQKSYWGSWFGCWLACFVGATVLLEKPLQVTVTKLCPFTSQLQTFHQPTHFNPYEPFHVKMKWVARSQPTVHGSDFWYFSCLLRSLIRWESMWIKFARSCFLNFSESHSLTFGSSMKFHLSILFIKSVYLWIRRKKVFFWDLMWFEFLDPHQRKIHHIAKRFRRIRWNI